MVKTRNSCDAKSPTELRVGYLCDINPAHAWSYSGGNKHLYGVVRDAFGAVDVIDQSWGWAEPIRRLVNAMPQAVAIRLRWRLHFVLGSVIGRRVSRILKTANYDLLFTAYSCQSLAGVTVPANTKVVFSSDATPTTYRQSAVGQSFGSFFRLSRVFDRFFTNRERRALAKAHVCLWPSVWQRDAAEMVYGLDISKSRVLPWGANVADPGPATPRHIELDGPLRFLFVGRDWQAKGGPLVASVVRQLRAKGLDAQLTVIGSKPDELAKVHWATVHPSLDKQNARDLSVLSAAFRDAHFMLLASFEAYGFAFCEAAAYGLPSLCLDVGGVPIEDGRSGHKLAPDATASDFVAVIEQYLRDPKGYVRLQLSTRDHYAQTLNWDAWRAGLRVIVAQVVANKDGS